MNLGYLFDVGTKLKESIKNPTKLVPQLQLEHGFYQQNGPERGQVQDWCTNGEMLVVVLIYLNGRRCSSWCVGIVWY